MQQAVVQRKQAAGLVAGLAAVVAAYIEAHPDARVVSFGARAVQPHLCPGDWGQPPLEDYLVHRVKPEPRAPAMRTRRDSQIQDALVQHASRWWLEPHADEDFVVVCAKSKRSGQVFRYRCRPSSAIVKWVQWEYEQQRLRATRYERCSCEVRGGELCPLCVEAWGEVEEADAGAREEEETVE